MMPPIGSIAPPASRAQLLERASMLTGRSLASIAQGLGKLTPGVGLHAKGKTGELIEAALGATGGPAARVDFPELGVELKTIPLRPDGNATESTFVCKVRLEDAEQAEWESSWVARKLRAVLWIPIMSRALQGGGKVHDEARTIGPPLLWEPTAAQDAALRADFEEIMGLAGIGRIEDISAHIGAYLQLRPKARDGTPRALAFGADGERVATVPRGFYLRSKFTGAILRDPSALP
jgi:DNA mismatch repair protein MutH